MLKKEYIQLFEALMITKAISFVAKSGTGKTATP